MARANMRDLSFATFNLLNLQVPGGLTYSNSPPIEDTPEGRDEYERKIGWTAAQLVLLDAEVIGFQELWSASALEDAFRAASLLDQYDLIARDAPEPLLCTSLAALIPTALTDHPLDPRAGVNMLHARCPSSPTPRH